MFKILQKQHILKCPMQNYRNLRTFLSQAYYCDDVWRQRLNSPILQKVNLENLYYELDQRFQKTGQLNALDIDVFANAIQDESFCEELLDIVHKLRLTADTSNTPESLTHAVVRVLLQYNKADDLLNALDDRLNYGLFLDYYTANLLMDTFWKRKEFANGARVASLLMLQEELEHPLSCELGLLHCYNYLLKPEGWPVSTPPEEPEEEVKIRVKYLRNPYDDEHFDLKEDKKIIGKTLIEICKNKNDPLHHSFHVLGLTLFGKSQQAKEVCNKAGLYKEILDLVPEDNEIKDFLNQLPTDSIKVAELLVTNVEKSYQKSSEKDITRQCQIFDKWLNERHTSMEEQMRRLDTDKRLQNIDDLQRVLKNKEEKLWFFDNEEKIDLAIDAKKKFYPKRWFGHKKKPRHVDEGYVPPEVGSQRS